jgi:large subunit ribosomal protein L15
MNLSDIRKAKIPRKYKFPVGRGHSSGIGKTCGRGRKGQYARQGESFRAYFEGGQMPMLRRLPKHGFNNKPFQLRLEEVNLRDLEKAFNPGDTVDDASLRAKGVVSRTVDGIAVLGTGALTKKLAVKVWKCTKSAEEKIRKAGGSVERLGPKPVEEKPAPAKAPEAKAAPAEKKAPEKKSKGGEPPAQA